MGKIITTPVYPPIPTNRWDWSAVTDNYEPGHPIGWGHSEAAATADLMWQLEDEGGLWCYPMVPR